MVFPRMSLSQRIFKGLIFAALASFVLAGAALRVSAQESPAEREARLRSELAEVEREIAEQQAILSGKQKESASLERDIAILNAKIKEAQLKIKAKNLSISQLTKDIGVKTATIAELERKIVRGKESLASMIRRTNELDEVSVIELLLSGQDMSDAFADADDFETIERAMQSLFEEIRDNKSEAESERTVLDKRKAQETDAKVAIEAEKRVIEKAEKEKNLLLSINKAQQKSYQQILALRQKRAAEIRSMLFALRDIAPIKFEEAVAYANLAYQKTGVRPAFLLAILKQETNLGANQGSCYLRDTSTGAGVIIKSGSPVTRVMKPERDVGPFLEIMDDLAMSYSTTPVSCPQSEGWGGAMGPSQFIPSTWKGIAGAVAKMVGRPRANPWNPEDAFMASAIFLRDLGAAQGGYSAERNAACRYYSGRACDTRRPINYTYGNSVMAKAEDIQENYLDVLQGI